MPFDINKFVNQSNPLSKIADKLSTSFSDRAENALLDSVGDIFAKVGLGASSGKDILSNLGDAVLAGIASEFFGSFNKDVNRISKEDIEKNKGFADADTEGLDTIIKSGPDSALPRYAFPLDLNKYYTLFTFKKYERPTPKEEAKYDIVGDIALPIPRNISDNHRVQYSEQNLGPLGNVMDYIAQKEKTYTGAGTTATAAMSRKIATRMFKNLSPEMGAISSQISGSIVNPALAVVFESPTFRRHSFEWMFAPESQKESDAVRDIIVKFKEASLPNFVQETTAVIQYPMLCKVSFMPWAKNDKKKNNLFEFKTAVIENVSVNYAPNTPAFFGDDFDNPAPVMIQLRVDLMEIEFVTAKEFGRNEATFEEVGKDSFDVLTKYSENMGVDALFPETAADGSATGSNTAPSLENIVYTATKQFTETLTTSSGGSKIMNYAQIGDEWYTQQILNEGNLSSIGQWEPTGNEAPLLTFATEITAGKFKPAAIPGNIVPYREAGS